MIKQFTRDLALQYKVGRIVQNATSQQKLVSWEQKIPESIFYLDTWKIYKDSKIILSLKNVVFFKSSS